MGFTIQVVCKLQTSQETVPPRGVFITAWILRVIHGHGRKKKIEKRTDTKTEILEAL